MVVIGIIAIMAVGIVPALISLTKGNGQKAAVSTVMNALEQARALAVTSGSATYVVFADATVTKDYRCRAFIVFQDDKNFAQVPVSKWSFLPTGIAFRPNKGLLTLPPASARTFKCPVLGEVPLPYAKFDANGMISLPSDANILFIHLFAGSVVDASGGMSYTDAHQKSVQKFDSVVLARFTGRARYVDPYSS